MQYLSYQDLSGRRRPRRYVWAAAGILALLAGVAVAGGREPAARESAAQESAPPESASLAPPAPLAPPPPAPTPTGCPDDPQSWTFSPLFPDDPYGRVGPACVTDGLARTAAWMLLVRMGHSKTAAAALLGFEALPWAPALSAETPGAAQVLPLLAEWPAHPAFQFWQVDRDGQPAVVLSLRGCGRNGLEVLCLLALDRAPGSAVSVLGDLHFASHAAQLPGQRSFFLLRYAGAQTWHLLGQIEGLVIEMDGAEDWAAERAAAAGRHTTVPWDAAWLAERFGLTMEPLPQDWWMFGMDEEAIGAIVEELDRYIAPDLGGSDG